MKAMAAIWSRFAAVKDQLKTWGAVLPRAIGDQAKGITIRVYAPGHDGAVRLVGKLWQERGDFFFQYDLAFASDPGADPISAFPNIDETYRSPELWPFFAVRIPPLRRADVKALLQKRGLRPDQTLEVLGTIARKSATNPYELALEAPSTGARREPPSTLPPAALHSAT